MLTGRTEKSLLQWEMVLSDYQSSIQRYVHCLVARSGGDSVGRQSNKAHDISCSGFELESRHLSSAFHHLHFPPALSHNQNFGNWPCGHEVQGDWITAMVTAAIICTSYQRKSTLRTGGQMGVNRVEYLFEYLFVPSESAIHPVGSNQQPPTEEWAPRLSRPVISRQGQHWRSTLMI